MVVVEQGRQLIGQDVAVVVTSVYPTPAGRMIFGRTDGRMSGTNISSPGATPGGSRQMDPPPPDQRGSGTHDPLRGPDGGRR